MIAKTIGLAVCFAAIASPTAAQELGIELNGGLQGTLYSLQNGESKLLPGASLGLNYVFPVSSQLGVLAGVTGGVYRTQASLQDGLYIYNRVDDAGSAFRYDVKFKGYKETQRFFAVSIPLLLQYHTNGKGQQWYIAGGGKIVLPLHNDIQVSAQQLSLAGYYPDYNVEVSNLPKHGFGTIDGYKGSASTQNKPTAALSAATGLCFVLSRGTRFYAGVYVDYGLTDLKGKSDSMPLVTYSAGGIDKVQANSVMNMRNFGPVRLVSFGLEVRLSFGSRHVKAVAQRKRDTANVQQVMVPRAATEPARSRPAKHQPEKPLPATERPATIQPGAVQPGAVQPRGAKPAAPRPVIQQPATSALSRREIEIVQRPVEFGAIGSSELPEAQRSSLDEVAEVMKQHPDVRISIVGHTCNDVKEKEDIKVGEARAKAVANYLQGKGINRRRMDVSYFRDSDPVQLYNPAVNTRNRRVVIMVE